jgi:hypothetical protein
MRALFDALLRFYEFDGPVTPAKTGKPPSHTERQLLDAPARDASTFPYLP